MRHQALLVIFVLLFVAGCSAEDTNSQLLRKARAGHLTVGVSFDHPGLAQRRADNTMRGFDVDVARFVAAELGVPDRAITWRQVFLPDRERVIEEDVVDMVVASYSITDQRKARVAFAGPYFVAGQDLLIRERDETITGPDSLDGKKLCSVNGTTSAQKIVEEYAARVELVEYNRFELCVRALLSAEVDAVTTDDLILAGYAAQNPELLRLVGRKFSEERYGIGLPRGDDRGRADVNAALRKMIDDGEWQAAIERNFGASGFVAGAPPAISED